MIRLTTKISLSLAAVLFAALMGASCGTRVGNPKMPGDDKRNGDDDGDDNGPDQKTVVVVPRINANLDATRSASSGLALQSQLTIDDVSDFGGALSEQPSRATVIVDALNALIDDINTVEAPLGERFVKTYPNGELTALIKPLDGQDGYDYMGVFCADGKVFYETRWQEDGNRIAAVRDFELNPFTADDPALQAGKAMKSEVTFELVDGTMRLTSRQHGVSKAKNPARSDRPFVTDSLYIESVGNGVLHYRGVADWQSEGGAANFTPDDYVSGRLEASGLHKLVGHSVDLPILCPNAFDEGATDAPQWCFGFERRKGQAVPKPLLAPQRAAFWTEISSIGFARRADLRAVVFTEQCPAATP